MAQGTKHWNLRSMTRKLSLIQLRTCGQSSRCGWKSKNLLTVTNSKQWLWMNVLPSLRIWPRSRLTACPGDCRGLEKEEPANIDSLHNVDVITNKSLWNLWSACNYTGLHHRNNWEKFFFFFLNLKTMKQQTLKTSKCVILKTFGHDYNIWD